MSEIVQSQMSEHEARRATERIRLALDRVSTAWADLAERVTEAYQRRADLALGYESWAEYADAELRPPEGLAIDVRRELVGLLSAAGMSTRAIAPVAGVSHMQVGRDAQVERNVPPEPVGGACPRQVKDLPSRTIATKSGVIIAEQRHIELAPDEQINFETGEIVGVEPRKVTGLDGKQYAQKTEAKSTPHRRAITDQFFDAAYDLNRRVESVRRLMADDRMPVNKNKIAQKHLGDLIQSRDLLQQVIDQLSAKE